MFIDTQEQKYFVVNAPDGCTDYGDYSVCTGEVSRVYNYATVNKYEGTERATQGRLALDYAHPCWSNACSACSGSNRSHDTAKHDPHGTHRTIKPGGNEGDRPLHVVRGNKGTDPYR